MVANAANGVEWDEALSGAAANLAIDLSSGTPIDSASVRWAGLKAGWPYPISHVGMELVAHQSECPRSLLESIPAHTHVGIARARGATADAWVILSSTNETLASPFSKQQPINSVFEIPYSNPEGLILRGYGATGDLQSGTNITFDHEGEWVVEVYSQQALILRAAIYVDGESPDYAPIEAVEPNLDNIDDEILMMINEVRGHFVDGNVRAEPILTSTSQRSLNGWINEGAPAQSIEGLGSITLTGAPPAELFCIGATPRSCVDQIYWSATHRGPLLNANYTGAGVSSEVIDGTIHAVIHLAGQ